MPPKPKYAKEEIVSAAFKLVREKGAEALTARELAAALNTSSRPIFTAFDNMSELKSEVVKMCEDVYFQFVAEEKAKGKYPEYKAMGMAYIRLAKLEKNIFKLLFMRDRTHEQQSYNTLFKSGTDAVQKLLSFDENKAERMHWEVWIWVHGIASMLATSYVDLEEEVISEMLTDVYSSLKGKYLNE